MRQSPPAISHCCFAAKIHQYNSEQIHHYNCLRITLFQILFSLHSTSDTNKKSKRLRMFLGLAWLAFPTWEQLIAQGLVPSSPAHAHTIFVPVLWVPGLSQIPFPVISQPLVLSPVWEAPAQPELQGCLGSPKLLLPPGESSRGLMFWAQNQQRAESQHTHTAETSAARARRASRNLWVSMVCFMERFSRV